MAIQNDLKADQIVRIMVLSIAIITVISGSTLWLKRVGLIHADIHAELIKERAFYGSHSWEFHQNPNRYSKNQMDALREGFHDFKKQLHHHIYSSNKFELVLKSSKYFMVILLVVTLLCVQACRLQTQRKKIIYCLVSLALLILVTLSDPQWQIVFVGINLMGVVIIVLIGYRIIDKFHLKYLSACLFFTLIILLLMMPLEYLNGLRIFNTSSIFGKRMVGFMNQPNTMGIYVICIFSLFLAFFDKKTNKIYFLLITLCIAGLLALSGSNTGSLTFILFLVLYYFQKSNETSLKQSTWLIALLTVTIIFFFFVEGRTISDSLFGRIEKYQYYFSLDYSLIKLLFGHGVGIGSNTLYQVQNYFPLDAFADMPIKFSTDSTPLLLLINFGIVGCLIFYGMILKAMTTDSQLRLTYLVFIVCSLTINIIEIFPLNLVLGLMLAKSFTEQNLPTNTNDKIIDTT